MVLSFISPILYSFCFVCLYAESKYPVDISYLVADFKYSEEEGVKICEVQQGALSALTGDLYISGGDGNISPLIADFFEFLPIKKWAAGFLYPPLQRSLDAKGWVFKESMKALSKDFSFLDCAESTPADPFSLRSYRGVVYAGFDIAQNFDPYRKAFPGILFIDAAALPYWKDKYKMNQLFERNEELKPCKADWRLYPKKYDSLLAERIQQEMSSEVYVIKPRGEFLANGVIVVASRDLDSVLRMILEPLAGLREHPDKKYAYWSRNRDETFLIEKYYESDYLYFSSPLSGSTHLYDATLRFAFILQYDEGKMTYHCLGGFWKLPPKAIDEEGTLNEKRISLSEPPFYAAIDPELFIEVNAQMEKAMLLLYKIMLSEPSLKEN